MNHLTYSPREALFPLETYGPNLEHSYRVNRYAGSYTPHGDIRSDIPNHPQRAPKNDDVWYDEQRQARRIHALMEAGKDRGHLTDRAYKEILRRLLTLHPLCLGLY